MAPRPALLGGSSRVSFRRRTPQGLLARGRSRHCPVSTGRCYLLSVCILSNLSVKEVRRYLRARSTNNIGTAVKSAGGNVDGIGLAGSFRPSVGWTYVVDVVGNYIAVHPQGKKTKQVALLARNLLPLSLEIDICVGAEYIQLNMLNATHDNLMLCLREPQWEVLDRKSVV